MTGKTTAFREVGVSGYHEGPIEGPLEIPHEWLSSNMNGYCFTLLWVATSRSGKSTAIRRTAVQEVGVSRYHGCLIEGTHETLHTSQNYRIEGFKGDP